MSGGLALTGMSLSRRCWKASVVCSRIMRASMVDEVQGASAMGALRSPSSCSSSLGKQADRASASREAAQQN